ncbi:MAG: dockerin type I repeat-containing protein [Clostridia bacterium]|nr:dockerin type I repeat-containing protein [Clostridia bacterium]
MANLRRIVLLLVCMLMIFGLTTTASAARPTIIDCSSGTIYASAGETVTLFVEADSNGKTFVWQAINDYTLPENESRYTSTYTFTMTPELDGAYVHCKVAFDNWNYRHSDGVSLELPILSIDEHPKGADLVVGMEAKTSIKATGEELRYDWYYSYENGEAVLLSQHTPDISVPLNKAGSHSFYCRVTDKSGQTRKSFDAWFTAYDPVYIKYDVSDQEAKLDSRVNLSFGVNGCDVTYQWYSKDAGSKNFTAMAGEDSMYLGLNVDVTCNGRQFYCIATDIAGNTVRSSIATLTVDTDLSIRGDCNICRGDGNCNRCGGAGWYWADSWNAFAEHVKVECDAELCNYGRCEGCDGDGWLSSKKDKPGDANMDSKVNTADVLMILQYAAGWNVSPHERTSNVYHDSSINARDAVLILQNIANK